MTATIPLSRVTFRPRSRSFVVGSTGSGKSTLLATLLEQYRREHPTHPIYLIDPKRRFFPREDDRSPLLFPAGARASNHGRREGVTVNARLIHQVDGFRFRDERAFLVQDWGKAHELFEWLYGHADVRAPALLVFDESQDFVRGTRAAPGMRRLLQQGREIGVGMVILNQRPAWVDGTFLSEADRLYVGMLHHANDRRRIEDAACIPNPWFFREPLPQYHWYLLDQTHPDRSFVFTLGEKAA